MDKPVLFYEVRVHQNRITGGPVYVPAIVEREEAVPLDEIIRRAIDRGLITGSWHFAERSRRLLPSEIAYSTDA